MQTWPRCCACLRGRAVCAGRTNPCTPQGKEQEQRAESAGEWEAVSQDAQVAEVRWTRRHGWEVLPLLCPGLVAKSAFAYTAFCLSRITCLISLLSYQTNFPLLLYHYGKGYSALKNRKYSTVKEGECAPRFKTFPQESQPLARALIELKKSFAFIASDCLWKFLRLALQEDCLLGCWLSLVQSYCWIWKSSIGNKCSLQTRYWNTHFVKVK